MWRARGPTPANGSAGLTARPCDWRPCALPHRAGPRVPESVTKPSPRLSSFPAGLRPGPRLALSLSSPSPLFPPPVLLFHSSLFPGSSQLLRQPCWSHTPIGPGLNSGEGLPGLQYYWPVAPKPGWSSNLLEELPPPTKKKQIPRLTTQDALVLLQIMLISLSLRTVS